MNIPAVPSSTSDVLRSSLDASANFVTRGAFPGAVEARYVRRSGSEVICYLSSQTGCRQACRFCHLTQSGQTALQDVDAAGYAAQARQVLSHYLDQVQAGEPAAATVNFNFMSRGEPLANPHLAGSGRGVLDALADEASRAGLHPRFKISTIMPKAIAGQDLAAMFGGHCPDLYLSLYSADDAWRRRWLPKALPASEALEMLAAYARTARKIPVIHWALIAGENDSLDDASRISDAVRAARLRCDVNLVRYNPFSIAVGEEPPEEAVQAYAARIAAELPFSQVQIVGRVGHDVKASCGMFVAGRGARRPDLLQIGGGLPSSRSVHLGFGSGA